jgi:TBC1 domain family protein 5
MFKDKEMRELITQDIDRTSQEYDFFCQKRVKDILISILFLWAKENQDT